ncbi:hypothetical protein VB774_08435 [Pseudanabaena galeata UHCC 0370]|uniref:Uncharacterized protein n=1 Tax=Pseudanabaena galeata UHCC 0370 TaxID=3110310 RepID=A0ABU5THC2_9CYAN|nr:hypothetical protein [Pseudanabaena galeata]MEA5477647.1 hypothetical protein [Pseudanabaena galeata UHCC 0370]
MLARHAQTCYKFSVLNQIVFLSEVENLDNPDGESWKLALATQ